MENKDLKDYVDFELMDDMINDLPEPCCRNCTHYGENLTLVPEDRCVFHLKTVQQDDYCEYHEYASRLC